MTLDTRRKLLPKQRSWFANLILNDGATGYEQASGSARVTRLKYAVFLLYVAVLAVAIARHEPWFDEAQSWLLARDATPAELITRYLRYEGSPGLWQFLLMIPAKAGLPYVSLNILSGMIAAAGVFVWVFYAPFPPAVVLLAPFTYFFAYQYSVVARSYVLLFPLLFLLAMQYRTRRDHPYSYVALLAALANVSVHGLLVAMALFADHVWHILRVRGQLARKTLRKHVLAWAGFGTLCLLLVVILWPPADFGFVTGYYSDPWVIVLRAGYQLERAMAGFWPLSLAVYLITALWLWSRGKLYLYLLVTIPVVLFGAIKYVNAWHQGIVFLLWLFALWVSFAGEAKALPEIRLRRAMTAAVVVLFAVQISWTARTVYFDFSHNYSGSRDIAEYLRARGLEGRKIYAFNFHSTAMLPYFRRNIFANYGEARDHAFWFWSTRNRMDEQLGKIEKSKPELIIVAIGSGPNNTEQKSQQLAAALPRSGYRLVRRFPGTLYWENRELQEESFWLFARDGSSFSAAEGMRR